MSEFETLLVLTLVGTALSAIGVTCSIVLPGRVQVDQYVGYIGIGFLIYVGLRAAGLVS